MDPWLTAVMALAVALVAQAVAAGQCAELATRRSLGPDARWLWGAFAVAALLAALHHGYSLELALRTGLFDLRQATIAALSGLLFALAAWGFRRRES